ncbi:MAG TPA: quinolinate synthase [Lachnospiraceae bacterium]|nr:quinolinate synthase [Lachnospiraceae bacterium]
MSTDTLFEIKSRIEQLKKEKNAVILAHYYTPAEVQEIADYVGDSFYLSKLAVDLKKEVLCYCGVSFMGESAKALNPEKIVVMPDLTADCPMAHMVNLAQLQALKKQYEDLTVVCYVNSTAEIKTYADVCVTSSNAVSIVKNLPAKHIFFIPDQHLGSYVASQVPEKHIILNDGYCPIHHEIKKEAIIKQKETHPLAKVLVHPECPSDVVSLADYVGSTSGILNYVEESDDKEFIIATEIGIFYELQKTNPNKVFYPATEQQICSDMKKITLNKVLSALETLSPTVEMSNELIERSKQPLTRMLELTN